MQKATENIQSKNNIGKKRDIKPERTKEEDEDVINENWKEEREKKNCVLLCKL